MAFEEMPELTAARIIASLNEEIDEKDTQIEDLETRLFTMKKYKDKAVDQASTLTSENNLLRAAGETYVKELAKAQVKVKGYENVRDLQADAIDRLNEQIKELKANPIVRNFCPTCGQPDNCGDCDHYMATDPQPDFLIREEEVADLQKDLKSAYAENESLRYRLRSINNSVKMHVKGMGI